MTFSDSSVAKALGREFVCAWMNMSPTVKCKDGMYDRVKCPMGLSRGTGVTNVTAIFAAADGTVIHAIPGYLDPASFLRHLEFAKSLYARLFDARIRRVDRVHLYAESHLEAAKVSGDELEKDSHTLLSNRYMRVDEFPKRFFYGLGRRD